MTTKLRMLLAALMLSTPLALAACDNEGPAERMGENLDEGAERTAEQLEEAGERIGDAAEDAGQDLERRAEDADIERD